jgi:type II secretory pathway pseudopilin PulG
VVLAIIGVVVVLLLVALPLAKRREQRKGRRPSSMASVRSAIRAGKEHKYEVQLRERPKPPGL